MPANLDISTKLDGTFSESGRSGRSGGDLMPSAFKGLIRALTKGVTASSGYDEESESEAAEHYANCNSFDSLDPDTQRGSAEEGTDPLSLALGYVRAQRDLLKRGNEKLIEEESRFNAWIEMDELQMLLAEECAQTSVRKWIRFDMLFGVFVLCNGAMLGLTTQGIVDEDAPWVQIAETCFLGVFVFEWCVRWYFRPTGFKGMLMDTWTLFDFMVIMISFVDTVILANFDLKSGASLVTTLRVVRLLRLVRLVRLFKLLKELWMLVSGMMSSIKILMWALFMFSIICYIFGLFVLEIARQSTMLEDPSAAEHWGSVLQAMLSLAQIATYSSQSLTRQLRDNLGWWILFVVFSFIFIASLGLLNLIIGVMLTSALSLAQHDSSYEDTVMRLLEHRALRALRELLVERCQTLAGANISNFSPNVTRNDLLAWVVEDAPAKLPTAPRWSSKGLQAGRSGSMDHTDSNDQISRKTSRMSMASENTVSGMAFKSMLKRAKVTTPAMNSSVLLHVASQVNQFLSPTIWKELSLAKAFAEAGITEDEINLIFNEIDSVHGHDSTTTVDEFIKSCIFMKGKVHELDMVNLLSAIHALYRRMKEVQGSIGVTFQELSESREQVTSLLEKYHRNVSTRKALKEEDDPAEAEEQEAPHFVDLTRQVDKQQFLVEQETLLAHNEKIRLRKRQNWDAFDGVVSMVVSINAVLLGLEATMSGHMIRDFRNPAFSPISAMWFALDQFFFFVYVVELVSRVLFHFQMEVQHDYRTWCGVFPKLLVVMDRPTFVRVLLSLPRWLSEVENLILYDLFILLVSGMDNFIMRMLDSGGDYSKFLGLIGLLRLTRLCRLVHLIQPLRVLVKGFASNTKLILWSLSMILGIIYAIAVAVVMMLADNPEAHQDAENWLHVGSAMLTLARMMTYNSWAAHMEVLGRHIPWIWPFGLAFMGITSMGILNLVTGIMVQAAFQIVMSEQDTKLNHKLNQTKTALQEAVARSKARAHERQKLAKALLQRRVRKMRQAILDEAVANAASSETAFTTHRPRLRRGNEQVLGSGDQITGFTSMATFETLDGRARNDERGPVPKHLRSILDARNQCTVSHATWVTEDHLAIGVCVKLEDERSATAYELQQAVLIWEGGRAAAKFFMPDEAPGGSEAELGEPARHRDCLGDLHFGGVPSGLALHFRYGKHWSLVPVFPLRPPEGFEDEDTQRLAMEDTSPVDKEVIKLSDLAFLVQDPVLIRRLQAVDLRTDQVLMAFQVLDVTGTGRVKAVDFIEGLLRLRRQELGLDTACAKSLMRRLMIQVMKLNTDTATCGMCFSSVVQKLRRVNLLDPKHEGDIPDEETEVAAHENRLLQENRQLRAKIARMRGYLERQRKLFQKDEGDEPEYSRGGRTSIASQNLGWD